MDLSRPFQVLTPTVDGDVLHVLARADAAFSARRVHQLAGRHSEEGVRKALRRLVRQGIVTNTRVGPSDQFRLNRQHLGAPYVLALARLRDEFDHRLTDQFEAWQLAPAYAALFGSAARGDMVPESDLDLFVVRPATVDADNHVWRDQLEGLTGAVTAWTGNDTRILEYSEAELDGNEIDPVIVSIRREGIRLFGPVGFLDRRPAA
jgi:predicted nucleotidyltransferase